MANELDLNLPDRLTGTCQESLIKVIFSDVATKLLAIEQLKNKKVTGRDIATCLQVLGMVASVECRMACCNTKPVKYKLY